MLRSLEEREVYLRNEKGWSKQGGPLVPFVMGDAYWDQLGMTFS